MSSKKFIQKIYQKYKNIQFKNKIIYPTKPMSGLPAIRNFTFGVKIILHWLSVTLKHFLFPVFWSLLAENSKSENVKPFA